MVYLVPTLRFRWVGGRDWPILLPQRSLRTREVLRRRWVGLDLGASWQRVSPRGGIDARVCPTRLAFPSILHFAPCFARSAKPGARGSSRWRRSTPPRAAASSAGARGRSAVASARPGSPGRCERAAPGATRCAHAAHELCAPQIAQTSKTPAFKRPRGTPMRFRGGCSAAIGAPFGGGCSGGRQLPADPSASGSGRRARFGGERRGGDF